ncbi:MAG TPA: 6-phosphofructokinase [Pirellulaceae bacterium]|jgi:6-phosphofructokinase 1|nr:6-phosphofructokinase [Pirellulaceae bacterium]
MPITPSPKPASPSEIKRVALLFAGGPAPAANAVISAAAASFLRNGIEPIGIKHGYSALADFCPEKRPLTKGEDYVVMTESILKRSRNSQGIMIGTARTNPGKFVSHPSHFQDKEKCAPLKRAYEALCSLEVDALVSIGGDDTLKTANKMKMYQDALPAGSRRIRVVHVPKTIDNDYHGIDFTFGYFTAVDFMAREIRNLLYDAEAGRAYFLVESMGRSAGWLAYGAAMAGEASLVISVEDIVDEFADEEVVIRDGKEVTRMIMNMDKVVSRILDTMLVREQQGKEYGVIVLAEGLAEYLPEKYLEGIPRDDHGHISIADVNLGRILSKHIAKSYKNLPAGTRKRSERKVNGVQLGYETRCSQPTAFDVMLGSQLGVGAYRALVEEKKDGVMVSIVNQLALRYERFEDLVDQSNLVTKVRYIDLDSDFHKLARFLETYVK